MAQSRTHNKLAGAPDYDDPKFWDVRFATGQDVGEWLNSGEMIIKAALSSLERPGVESKRPRILHLGPGLSQVGAKLRDACINRQWMVNGIVNVDFSAEAVRQGIEAECRIPPNQAMHWHCADLLSWKDVSDLSPFAPFDVIVDKSTSDAISTSSDRDIATIDTESLCPTVEQILSTDPISSLSPVELLGLHLVPLTRKETTWIALSYSTLRFDNLSLLGRYWTLCSRTPIQAPAGESSSAYTPEVFHWLYILERK